jgi:hypothetical protein
MDMSALRASIVFVPVTPTWRSGLLNAGASRLCFFLDVWPPARIAESMACSENRQLSCCNNEEAPRIFIINSEAQRHVRLTPIHPNLTVPAQKY